jgi:hypothetical protein
MPDKGTSKKITRIGEESKEIVEKVTKPFIVSEESRKKSTIFRFIAFVCWIAAIGIEVYSILLLRKPPVNTTLLIILIAVALVLSVTGSLLWKKSNRLNPASEKDSVKFFIQNQLGAFMGILAFLPLVIFIFTNKNLSGKQKSLVGSIAAIALVVAGITGIDFNPPSQEQYSEQTQEVESLNNGVNLVYWTKYGSSYHLYQDCSYINTARTDEIFEGTVAQARELKNITDLCDRCRDRAAKENGVNSETEQPVSGQ